jgi:hypothetical protein
VPKSVTRAASWLVKAQLLCPMVRRESPDLPVAKVSVIGTTPQHGYTPIHGWRQPEDWQAGHHQESQGNIWQPPVETLPPVARTLPQPLPAITSLLYGKMLEHLLASGATAARNQRVFQHDRIAP